MRSRIVYGHGGKRRFFLDDREVTEEEHNAHTPHKIKDLLKAIQADKAALPAGHTTTCWPMLSDGMGVHPKQIAEATARNKRHGCNVTYAEDGRAILPDRGARRDLLRVEGLHDKSGGYGD